jgi:short subunit dehydrogenase-like uncharacterized protein
MEKKYDLIVYGASGFTGQLICKYLSSHKDILNLNWAIAGRDLAKLELLSNKLSTENRTIDVLYADSFDKKSLNDIASQSKLIITTVGPYAIYGEQLVESCIENQTFYLDLTGEPHFVHKIKAKYTQKAYDNNVAIIHSCGFESIPPDLGVYSAINQLNEPNADVSYFFESNGDISGGTWASFINSLSSPIPIISKGSKKRSKSKNKKNKKKIFFHKEFKRWALFFPVIDKYIVQKTAKSFSQYGEDFSFNEYMLFKSWKKLAFIIIGIFIVSIISKIKFIKKWLLSLRPSGSGPSPERISKNWFIAKVIAKGQQASVLTTIKGGDPGYGDTSKFISEMALCILTQRDQLLNSKGILTPVECTGDLLLDRLRNAGISIDTKRL